MSSLKYFNLPPEGGSWNHLSNQKLVYTWNSKKGNVFTMGKRWISRIHLKIPKNLEVLAIFSLIIWRRYLYMDVSQNRGP